MATVQIPRTLGFGGAFIDNEGRKMRLFLDTIAADLLALKTAFDSHKHRYDSTVLDAATTVTGVPVTGTASGTPTGGTAIAAVTVNLTGSGATDY